MQQSQLLIGQMIGQDATLQCIVTANPQPAVTWTVNDRPLPTSSKYVTSNGPWYTSMYARTFNLVINDITADDFGTYKCTVVNTLGQAQLTIKLVGK